MREVDEGGRCAYCLAVHHHTHVHAYLDIHNTNHTQSHSLRHARRFMQQHTNYAAHPCSSTPMHPHAPPSGACPGSHRPWCMSIALMMASSCAHSPSTVPLSLSSLMLPCQSKLVMRTGSSGCLRRSCRIPSAKCSDSSSSAGKKGEVEGLPWGAWSAMS